MQVRRNHRILILIFLVVLSAELYFSLQTPYLDNSGYLVERYTQNVLETGKPLFYDTLSYNGREVLYSPLWHYVLAIFGLVFGSFAFKLVPALVSSSIVLVVYLLSKKIVDNDELALFIALMSGFIPVVFVDSLISASVYSLAIPLMFYLIYLFMDLNEKNVGIFLTLSFFLSLLHPVSILFSLGLMVYYLLSLSENMKIPTLNLEVMAFTFVSTFLIQFLIYKKAFLEYGFSVIWHNVPSQILWSYFDFDIFGMLYRVGALTLIFGLIGIIWGIIKRKDRIMLLCGFALATLILLWLRLLEPRIGMMFLSVALVVASAFTLNLFLNYLGKTKLPHYRLSFIMIVLGLIISSLAVPSFVLASKHIKEDVPSGYELLVLRWIRENALPDVTIVAPLGKGHIMTALAGKRTVLDDNFLLAPETSERYGDIERLYSTKSEVEALEIIAKYNIDYVFIPIETELEYGKVKWTDDESCFRGIFFGTPKVYQVIC
ncbi:MAG: hypothetical protein AABX49_02035 [Nanoarchaeota archaeon]